MVRSMPTRHRMEKNKPSRKGIKLQRESVVVLSVSTLNRVASGQRDPTASCGCTHSGSGMTC